MPKEGKGASPAKKDGQKVAKSKEEKKEGRGRSKTGDVKSKKNTASPSRGKSAGNKAVKGKKADMGKRSKIK